MSAIPAIPELRSSQFRMLNRVAVPVRQAAPALVMNAIGVN